MNYLFDHLDPLDPVSAALYEASRRHDTGAVHCLLDQDILRRPDPDQDPDALRIQVPKSLIDALNEHPEHYIVRPGTHGSSEAEAADYHYLCVSPEGLVAVDVGREVVQWDWAFMTNLPRNVSARALADWLGRSTTQARFAEMLRSCTGERGNIEACHQLSLMVKALPTMDVLSSQAVCEIFIDQVDDERLHEHLTIADLLDEVITQETLAPQVVILDPPEVVRAQLAPLLAREVLDHDRPLPYSVVQELHEEGLLPGPLTEHLLSNAINALDGETALALIEHGTNPDTRGHAGRPVAHVLRTLGELARLRELGGDVMARDAIGETALSLAERRIEECNQASDREIAMYLRSLIDHQVLSSVVTIERPSKSMRRM